MQVKSSVLPLSAHVLMTGESLCRLLFCGSILFEVVNNCTFSTGGRSESQQLKPLA